MSMLLVSAPLTCGIENSPILHDTRIQTQTDHDCFSRDRPAVAGYNSLDEPADPEHVNLMSYYTGIEKETRKNDPGKQIDFRTP